MRYLLLRTAGTLALLFAVANLLAGVIGGLVALVFLPDFLVDLSGDPGLRAVAGWAAFGVFVWGVCNALLLYSLGHLAWLVPHLIRRVHRLESTYFPGATGAI